MPTDKTMVGQQKDSDEDEEETEQEKARLAAMASVVIDSAQVLRNASVKSFKGRDSDKSLERAGAQTDGAACCALKHYQIRGQELLHRILDRTFGSNISDDNTPPASAAIQQPVDDEAGDIRLFGRAPPGFSLRVKPEADARRRKGKSPRQDKHEKSMEDYTLLQAVAVDGKTILQQAEKENAKAKAAEEAAQAASKQAAIQEQERVASLKAQRGEEWLPSVAKELGVPLDTKGVAREKNRKHKRKRSLEVAST